MMKTVEVLVTWLEPKIKTLPRSHQYITVAKFDEDKDAWEKEAWSIVLEFSESPFQQGNPSRGSARFLIEDAPIERLVSGKKFAMYEGRKKMAEVQIL